MTSTMRFDKWENSLGQPYGTVLQVVQAVKSDTFTSASTSYVDVTGLSATITPSSTSSKILVAVELNGSGTVGISVLFFQIVRNSTAIGIGNTAGNRTSATNSLYAGTAGTLAFSGGTFLDSPATTSAITYKVQLKANTTATSYINRAEIDNDGAAWARTISTITLMEIAQ